MVSPYLNRPLRSLEEVLRARGEAPEAVLPEASAAAVPPPESCAGSRRRPEAVPDEPAPPPVRREAA